MSILKRWSIVRMLVAAVLTSSPAQAQTGQTGQTGWALAPSLSMSEIYDDNLFSASSGRESDLITRLSPGLKGGYESEPLTLLGRYSFDAEYFARHTELSDHRARQIASIQFRHLPSRRLTLALEGTYLKTQTPAELNLETALEAVRVQARRFSINPSMILRFNRLMTGRMDSAFTREESGGVRTRTQTMALGIDRRITSKESGSFDYTFRRFDFEGDQTVRSQTFLLGWTHEIRPSTRFTLRAGPRFSEGSADTEASAEIHHESRSGEASLSYQRSQTNVIGLAGAVETDSVTLSGTYRPGRSVTLGLSPGFFRSTQGDLEAEVYRVDFKAEYRITKKLSLTGSYQFSLQRGRLDLNTDEEIHHALVVLGLEAAFR